MDWEHDALVFMLPSEIENAVRSILHESDDLQCVTVGSDGESDELVLALVSHDDIRDPGLAALVFSYYSRADSVLTATCGPAEHSYFASCILSLCVYLSTMYSL